MTLVIRGASNSLLQKHLLQEVSVPYTDLIGNIRALIAASPTYYPYSIYGEGYPENASPYRYHGKRQTLSIYNFGARAYDPQTAQWLSEDPAGYKDDPFLHKFLKNNPFRYSDEFGFSVNETDQKMLDYWCENVIPKYEQDWNHSVSTAKWMVHRTLDFGYFCGESFVSLAIKLLTCSDCTICKSYSPLESFKEASTKVHTHIDNTLRSVLNVDASDQTHQNSRWLTSSSISAITIARAGYGLVHSGISRLTSHTTSRVTKITTVSSETRLSFGAENINSGMALRSKLSGLQKAHESATRTRIFTDGRIRYYTQEISSSKKGLTRGASYVTEWNPKNGQQLKSMHYPPIGRELGVK